MALSFTDLYLINTLGDRNNIRTRAQTLQDNFGIRPMEVEDYRSQNGGFGILKALAWAVGIGVAAGLIASVLPIAILASNAILIGVGLGMAAGEISLIHQNRKIMRGYSSYLDGVAAQGRESRDRGIAPSRDIEYDNDMAKSTSHAEDLIAQQVNTGTELAR